MTAQKETHTSTVGQEAFLYQSLLHDNVLYKHKRGPISEVRLSQMCLFKMNDCRIGAGCPSNLCMQDFFGIVLREVIGIGCL